MYDLISNLWLGMGVAVTPMNVMLCLIGALVGTLNIPATIDGGGITAPSLAFYDNNGRWAIENEGIAPDVEVEITPADAAAGRDPQLERAVQEAMRLLKEHPVERSPKEPPPPTWGKRPSTR